MWKCGAEGRPNHNLAGLFFLLLSFSRIRVMYFKDLKLRKEKRKWLIQTRLQAQPSVTSINIRSAIVWIDQEHRCIHPNFVNDLLNEFQAVLISRVGRRPVLPAAGCWRSFVEDFSFFLSRTKLLTGPVHYHCERMSECATPVGWLDACGWRVITMCVYWWYLKKKKYCPVLVEILISCRNYGPRITTNEEENWMHRKRTANYHSPLLCW